VTLDNDPLDQLRLAGEGIYYLGRSFRPGSRAFRIDQQIRERLSRQHITAAQMTRPTRGATSSC